MRITLLCLSLLLVGCQSRNPLPMAPGSGVIASTDKKPSPPPVSGILSLNSRDWTTLSNPSRYPLSTVNGALTFDFRRQPDTMNYLYTTRIPRPLSGSLVIAAHVTASAPIWWFFDNCGIPLADLVPYARPFVFSSLTSNTGRWWSNPVAFDLRTGSVEMTIPLVSTQFTGVFGQSDAAAFAQTLATAQGLGLTFGHQCFYGHGIGLTSGAATFSLTHYEVR